MADRRLLVHALVNLLKNAVEASASGGEMPRIALRTRSGGPSVRVEVADNGVGGADDGNGSGLRGLADRVEALGGRLEVVSPAGRGTVLTAEVPCGS